MSDIVFAFFENGGQPVNLTVEDILCSRALCVFPLSFAGDPMRLFKIAAISFTILATTAFAVAQQDDQNSTSDQSAGEASSNEASLFDNAAAALRERFVYQQFREEKLPGIIERHRDRAKSAKTLAEQRQVVHDLLSEIPASHMGVLSKSTFRHLMGELFSKTQPTFGFELMELDGKHFAHSVLEGGPAAEAGLRRGDRIMLIDGLRLESNDRLDWRSDDSFLVDPPIRRLKCQEGDSIKLLVEREWGDTFEIELSAENYSAFMAARASAKTITIEGKKIGYIHFWFIHLTGVAELLKEKLEGEFADCDALIIDLRGRGGSGGALQGIYDVLSGKNSDWNRPVIALVNRRSRSAKEVMAYEMKRQEIALIVGERTAGAVIPASFAEIGDETMLMFPAIQFGNYTSLLEGKGVEPDLFVMEAGPYSAGADPLLETGLLESVKADGQ